MPAFDASLTGHRLYRGNLHMHTAVSDGRLEAPAAIQWYRDQGYDFVAQTDHWKTATEANSRDLLVVPGVEFDGTDPELGAYHIVGLGVSESPERYSLGAGAAAITEHIAQAAGLAQLAHPYWCGMPSWTIARIPGLFALEVYNSTCEVHIAKGFSAVHWDNTLAAGNRIWATAVDDTHWGRQDYGGGWVMVQAEELSVPALLQALAVGRFYSSTGADIAEFRVDGSRAYARTSAAQRIAFVSDAWRGACVHDESGAGITEAEADLSRGATYVRLEVLDAQGRRAWSNPIYL